MKMICYQRISKDELLNKANNSLDIGTLYNLKKVFNHPPVTLVIQLRWSQLLTVLKS